MKRTINYLSIAAMLSYDFSHYYFNNNNNLQQQINDNVKVKSRNLLVLGWLFGNKYKDLTQDDTWKKITCAKTEKDLQNLDDRIYSEMYQKKETGNVCCFITNMTIYYPPFPGRNDDHCMNAFEDSYVNNNYPIVTDFEKPTIVLHGTDIPAEHFPYDPDLWTVPGYPENEVIRSQYRPYWPYYYAEPYIYVLEIADGPTCYDNKIVITPEKGMDFTTDNVYERIGYINVEKKIGVRMAFNQLNVAEVPDAIVYTNKSMNRCNPTIIGTYKRYERLTMKHGGKYNPLAGNKMRKKYQTKQYFHEGAPQIALQQY